MYVFSGSKVIAEYVNGAAPASPTREYIYSGGALLAKIEGGATQYYHQDAVSVRLMTDANGAKIGEQGHFPYGEQWYATSTTTKWQYTSYERDAESNNDYAMAREYIDRLGRFNAPDPLGGSTSDPQSFNRYPYARNNPVNLVDPSGLFLIVPPLEGGNGPFGWDPEDCVPLMYVRPNPTDAQYSNIQIEQDMLSALCVPPPHARSRLEGGGGGRGRRGGDKKKELLAAALGQKNLSKCLHEFFGPGQILTNANLPRIDASEDLANGASGETRSWEVPETGRASIYIDKGTFAGLSGDDPFLVGTYLHEVANVLAIQRFTNVQARAARPYRGPLGGPPTADQERDSWDHDIGQQFEKCIKKE